MVASVCYKPKQNGGYRYKLVVAHAYHWDMLYIVSDQKLENGNHYHLSLSIWAWRPSWSLWPDLFIYTLVPVNYKI